MVYQKHVFYLKTSAKNIMCFGTQAYCTLLTLLEGCRFNLLKYSSEKSVWSAILKRFTDFQAHQHAGGQNKYPCVMCVCVCVCARSIYTKLGEAVTLLHKEDMNWCWWKKSWTTWVASVVKHWLKRVKPPELVQKLLPSVVWQTKTLYRTSHSLIIIYPGASKKKIHKVAIVCKMCGSKPSG